MIKKLLCASLLMGVMVNAESEAPKKDKYEEWCDNLRLNEEQLKLLKIAIKKKLHHKLPGSSIDLSKNEDDLLALAWRQIYHLGMVDWLYYGAANHQLRDEEIISKNLLNIHDQVYKKCNVCVKKKLAALKEQKTQ